MTELMFERMCMLKRSIPEVSKYVVGEASDIFRIIIMETVDFTLTEKLRQKIIAACDFISDIKKTSWGDWVVVFTN